MQKKNGVSLIVLVITLTSTYDKANKIDRIPPENNIDKKVVSFCKFTTFFDINEYYRWIFIVILKTLINA